MPDEELRKSRFTESWPDIETGDFTHLLMKLKFIGRKPEERLLKHIDNFPKPESGSSSL
ncbi:uncharacterized protein PHALS_12500 [Plasmopara halstedii]|uniref:Uncharacterized protein n=1 Tax=Plasmopara halstedii TaxID=4781 RepID=A0A0P1ALL3_PLAHL|nr:uncharacterized protein PHALS_12500 [Plasmopara halstedii]CEG42206.1 hypothetical protein PHALS_12500 [Plasmopara halstedii]|eukprot:XP_024578575.1 hypothetical protein PHALS_12500 [Plasmopara halstedii]